MKKPEEIKEGLRHCNPDLDCPGCPYEMGNRFECINHLLRDALARIQQLERKNIALAEDKDFYKGEYTLIERQLGQALYDMKNIVGNICLVCEHFYRPDPAVRQFACKAFGTVIHPDGVIYCGQFTWRGVKEDAHG